MQQNSLLRRGVGLRGVDHTIVSPGYMLYAHLTSPGTVRLISNDGQEVHKWELPIRPGRHAKIMPDGNLAYNGVHPDSPRLFPMWQKYRGGRMLKVDPSGKILQQWDDPLAHHDQNHLEDGSGHLLYTTVEELSDEKAAQIVGGIPGSEAPGNKVYADCIKHVNPADGTTLWHWKASEHLDPQKFPLNEHFDREHWPLINSVAQLKDGNILASLRSVSAVIIISRITGEILWHLDSTVLAQQHCASELGNGNILIFDNGTFRHHESATYSRVIEVDRISKKIVWQYRDKSGPMSFFSPFMGGAQRLQNGNTLITEAVFGRVFEVTHDGKIAWEYVNPHFADYKQLNAPELDDIGFDYPANGIFRAYKYTPAQISWLSLPSPAPSP